MARACIAALLVGCSAFVVFEAFSVQARCPYCIWHQLTLAAADEDPE